MLPIWLSVLLWGVDDDVVGPWEQPLAKPPLWNDKIRQITTGDLNFLHTTDTHGWYLGHLNQRQYSGDWGDFVSFETHLRNGIEKNGGDLITIDTGDRHDGNGLSDLTKVNGQLSNEIFSGLDYDLITVGNHELYKAAISELEFNTLVPQYGDRFISTNVKYKNDEGEWVIFGNNTHRYFQTKVNKYNVFALSFLFDFKWFNDRVKVEPIESVIKSKWFLSLLRKFKEDDHPIDIIVIFGHLPVTHEWLEMGLLHKTIRSFFPNILIQYFGGHSHIRDFTILDKKATGLQSGRYCETIGFLSIKDIKNVENNLKSNIFRSYIDFNKHSFITHTNKTLETFDTEGGLQISEKLTNISKELNLDETYGYVPHSFYTSAADYLHDDSNSLLRFLEGPILSQLEPLSCAEDIPIGKFNNSRIILINTGGIRYDMYKGPFTKNSLFTVSPFKNKWNVIPNVPKDFAIKLKGILNNGPFIMGNKSLKSPRQLALDSKPMYFENFEFEFTDKKKSYGYLTIDDFGNDGDDTIHKPFHNYYVPNVIQSYKDEGDDKVDVVYYDFIEPFILKALEDACIDNEEIYLDLINKIQFYNNCENKSNLGQLLKKYVQDNWQS